MTEDQVRHMIIQDEEIEGFIETHISFVLLTKLHAYKIKKAVQFSFLDFSTIENRKYYCEQELVLNQRLAKDMYQQVVPVKQNQSTFSINVKGGEIVDYALQMKRMDNAREMHLLLEANQVTLQDIDEIVEILVPFHKDLPSIRTALEPDAIKEIFNDIRSVQKVIRSELGPLYENILIEAITFSDRFVEEHLDELKRRIDRGMIRNCHGDLHSRNIFLDDKVIIFDCIEFNQAFREIDILYELAFFCMDLDVEGHETLSRHFMEVYLTMYPEVMEEASDQALFLYYKLYRANVRAKVTALKIAQADSPGEKQLFLDEVEKYLSLIEKYLHILEQGQAS